MSKYLTKPRLIGLTVLILWLCLAIDVFSIVPKRFWSTVERFHMSAAEKQQELWGGFYVISKALRSRGSLGATVGIPLLTYAEGNKLSAPYGHVNYNALCYPGRAVLIENRSDLEKRQPQFLLLEKNWPEFSFPGDPRPENRRSVDRVRIIEMRYD